MKTDTVMVGIGEILWDMLPNGKKLGGAPANFAFHSCQLGNQGVVVSSVGKDQPGDEIIVVLEKKGVTHLLTRHDRFPTGRVDIEMDSEGIPSYVIHEDVAWDYIQLNEQHIDLAKRADAVCFGTLASRNQVSADQIIDFLSHTGPDCLRVFDINLRRQYYQRDRIEMLLQKANIVKLNDEELFITGKMFDVNGSESDVLSFLKEQFSLHLVALTRGAAGSRLFAGDNGDSTLSGKTVEVVDTIGAGDSFTASLVTGICRGFSLQKTHRLAAAVSAYVCGHAGATPELPPLDFFINDGV